MTTITVYTATYNRANLLPRVYESLCRQTLKDFIWLIIDDGSTDNTQKLVQNWISQKKINIRYQYKDNGGVHTARDMAYRICETELITDCDSDDYFVDDAIEQIVHLWRKSGGKKYAGIFSAPQDEKGNRTCKPFPPVSSTTYQDFTYHYKCKGEKHTVLRTDIIQTIPDAPVFFGETLVGEAYKWIQLPEDRPFLLLDRPIRIVDFQPNGYTNTACINRFKNPNGFRAYYRQHIISSKYIRPCLKGHLGYIAFSLILKDRRFIIDAPKPFMTLLMLPFGLAVYLYFLWQRRSYLCK